MILAIVVVVVLCVGFYYGGKTAKGAAIKSEVEAELIKIETAAVKVEKVAVADVKAFVTAVRAKL